MDNDNIKWPRINGANTELAQILKEMGYEVIGPCGGSGFAARNFFEIRSSSERSPEKVKQAIELAEQEKERRYKKNYLKMIEEKSNDGGITAVITVGGDKSLYNPSRFIILAEKRVACTQDYRRHRSHTYERVCIDTQKVQGKKFVTIRIPDCYKGAVIGKAGKNIKAIQKKLGCFIKIL